MIHDARPESLEYDATIDVATLTFAAEGATKRSRTVAAQLLLDASGFLVGVDLLDAYAAQRVVAMLGPHEAVANVRGARVELGDREDGAGPQWIRVASAKDVRAGEKSPYGL